MTIENKKTKQLSNELFVFDFDETIIDCNTDTYIDSLAPNGKIPKEFWKANHEQNWPEYVQQVFIYLHKNGVRKEDYKKCLATIPFVNGMENLIRHLAIGSDSKRFELIIISDANSFSIPEILSQHKLLDCFKEIITNSAHFDESGCLRIKGYQEQNWCKISPRNLCKGHVLEEYISKRKIENVLFDRVHYVGDGSNDLCPSLKLTSNDYVYPRSGSLLHQMIKEKLETSDELKAKIIPFKTGEDIRNAISSF